MMARVIESTSQEVSTRGEKAEVFYISICNHIVVIKHRSLTKSVTIDPDIGCNTVFTIGSQDFNNISLSIESPNGYKYDSSSPELTSNAGLKQYQLKLSTAEPCVWSINLNNHSKQTIEANITVKSRPSVFLFGENKEFDYRWDRP